MMEHKNVVNIKKYLDQLGKEELIQLFSRLKVNNTEELSILYLEKTEVLTELLNKDAVLLLDYCWKNNSQLDMERMNDNHEWEIILDSALHQIEGIGLLVWSDEAIGDILYIPDEIGEKASWLLKEYEEWLDRSLLVEKLVLGMLYYYGVIEKWTLYQMIQEHVELQEEEFEKLLHRRYNLWISSDMIKGENSGKEYVCDIDVLEPEKIISQQNVLKELPYRRFTSEQYLQASQSDYLEEFPNEENIEQYFVQLGLTVEEAQILLGSLIYQLKNGQDVNSIIKELKQVVEDNGTKGFVSCVENLRQLFNQIPLWGKKGYSLSYIKLSKRG